MQKAETTEQYAAIKKAAENALGLVVHFSATWCEPCKAVNEFLEKQAAAYESRVIFAEVDCEKLGDVCESEGVESVPFIAFFRTPIAGDVRRVERVADVVGAKLDLISMNIRSLFGDNGGKGVQKKDFPSVDDYLKYLTTRKGVVMFITGTPSRPRCGFTGRLCELVQALNVPFTYYDVMASDEVCERLKTYANWPTYPQVYVDGELIGGWDICRELNEEGQLKATLKY
ncbi:thioredoxin-like protein [Lotmaria passim]